MTVNMDSMIECSLAEPDDFLKVRETLTRIGVASRKEKTLYQSCQEARWLVLKLHTKKKLITIMEQPQVHHHVHYPTDPGPPMHTLGAALQLVNER